MTDKPVLEPNPNHSITIEPAGTHVVVTAAGGTIADSSRAQRLTKARIPPDLYVPGVDVGMKALERSETHSYSPHPHSSRRQLRQNRWCAQQGQNFLRRHPLSRSSKKYQIGMKCCWLCLKPLSF